MLLWVFLLELVVQTVRKQALSGPELDKYVVGTQQLVFLRELCQLIALKGVTVFLKNVKIVLDKIDVVVCALRIS